MRITIEYPEVMKMTLFGDIHVEDTATLMEVKAQILQSFWKLFTAMYTPAIGIHGTVDDVTLKDKGVEILSDSDLREHLMASNVFQATFGNHRRLLLREEKKEEKKA